MIADPLEAAFTVGAFAPFVDAPIGSALAPSPGRSRPREALPSCQARRPLRCELPRRWTRPPMS